MRGRGGPWPSQAWSAQVSQARHVKKLEDGDSRGLARSPQRQGQPDNSGLSTCLGTGARSLVPLPAHCHASSPYPQLPRHYGDLLEHMNLSNSPVRFRPWKALFHCARQIEHPIFGSGRQDNELSWPNGSSDFTWAGGMLWAKHIYSVSLCLHPNP